MGAAWKAFKVFLMVLGAIVFLLFAAILIYWLVAMLTQRSQRCDSGIDFLTCLSLGTQTVILEADGFDIHPVSNDHEIGLIERLSVDEDSRPTYEQVFVYYAPEVSEFKLSGRVQSKQEVIARHTKFLESLAKEIVCDEKARHRTLLGSGGLLSLSPASGNGLRSIEEPSDYRGFVAAGGALSFKIGITNEERVNEHRFSKAGNLFGTSTKPASGEAKPATRDISKAMEVPPFHFEVGPITITSCEDKP